jgi:chromosomal replication initiation ATPase DnaA
MKKHELEAKLTEYLKTLTDNEYIVQLKHPNQAIKEDTAKNLINECEKEFNYHYGSIISKWKKTELVRIRHSIFYIMYYNIDLSLAKAGRVLNRDHSTVLTANRRVSEVIENPKLDKQLYNTYNQVYAIYQRLI